MEFKESLLQNEVQYLNKNFSLVSAELIVIQEFLEQEFGKKFKAFLNARREQRLVHSSASQMHLSTKSRVGECGTVSNYSSYKRNNSTLTQDPLATRRITRGSTRTPAFQVMTENKEVGEECTEISEDEEHPFIISEQDSDSSSVGYFDPTGTIELDDSSEEEDGEQDVKPNVESVISLKEDLNASEPKPGVSGRRKSVIHRYFDKVQTEDGVMKAKCKGCGRYVSSQAQRMRKHTIKCEGQGRDRKVDKKVSQKLKVPINKSELNTSKILGHRRDRVWLVFKEHKLSDGLIKMQCVNCSQLVSKQPKRMRHHLEKCSGQKGMAVDDWIDSQVKLSVAASNLPDSLPNDVTDESTSSKKVHKISGDAHLSPVLPQLDSGNTGNTNSSSSLILVPQTQDSAKPVSSSCYESASVTNQSYPMDATGWSESAETFH